MIDLLADPQAWISLLTLSVLEVVLGIDNIIFISILAGKLARADQPKARRFGLMGAFMSRVALLLSITWVMRLTEPLFTLVGRAVSGRDLILLGGGALSAGKAAVEIAEKLKAPIITTTAGKGAVPTNHPLCLGQILAREGFWTLAAESDAILCVGSELSETDHWNDAMAIEKNLIRIDLDPAVMARPHTAEVAILGDAREALELIASVEPAGH